MAASDVSLVHVDKYGNECGMGGASLQGKLSGSDLPPGQAPGDAAVPALSYSELPLELGAAQPLRAL